MDTDIDECAEVICRDGSTCINSPGSYLCSCPKGFDYNKKIHTCDGVLLFISL